jgi:hypothetical protein
VTFCCDVPLRSAHERNSRGMISVAKNTTLIGQMTAHRGLLGIIGALAYKNVKVNCNRI